MLLFLNPSKVASAFVPVQLQSPILGLSGPCVKLPKCHEVMQFIVLAGLVQASVSVEQVQERVEPTVIEAESGGGADDGFGLVCDPGPGEGEHGQVVGPIA
jgi:hypothetical protein